MGIDNSNKKVLLITVGTGQNGKDIAHGLNFSISQQNPDIIYLILTKTSKEQTRPHLKLGSAEVKEKEIDNPDDVELITEEINKLLAELIRKYGKSNISVDYTSGTKAMSAAIVASALSYEINSLSYVYGQRKEGRVISGSEKLSILKPNKLLNCSRLKLFKEFFNKSQFVSAIQVLESIEEVHPDYAQQIEFYYVFARAFDLWDKFDFQKSFELFDTISSDYKSLLQELGLKSKTEMYKAALNNLKNSEMCIEQVRDLLSNAKRRSEEGKYDDAVARLYRAIEMLGQIEFKKAFGCQTDDVDIYALPEQDRDYYAKKYKDEKDNKIKLGLYAVYHLLNLKGNELGKLFKQNEETMKKLLTIRNTSILAHGLNPVSEKSFNEFYSIMEKFGLSSGSEFPKLQ